MMLFPVQLDHYALCLCLCDSFCSKLHSFPHFNFCLRCCDQFDQPMALGHADMVLLLALAARVREAMAKDGFVPKLAQKKNVKDDDDDAMFPMFPWEEEEDNLSQSNDTFAGRGKAPKRRNKQCVYPHHPMAIFKKWSFHHKLVKEHMDRKCRVLLLTRALKKEKNN